MESHSQKAGFLLQENPFREIQKQAAFRSTGQRNFEGDAAHADQDDAVGLSRRNRKTENTRNGFQGGERVLQSPRSLNWVSRNLAAIPELPLQSAQRSNAHP